MKSIFFLAMCLHFPAWANSPEVTSGNTEPQVDVGTTNGEKTLLKSDGCDPQKYGQKLLRLFFRRSTGTLQIMRGSEIINNVNIKASVDPKIPRYAGLKSSGLSPNYSRNGSNFGDAVLFQSIVFSGSDTNFLTKENIDGKKKFIFIPNSQFREVYECINKMSPQKTSISIAI